MKGAAAVFMVFDVLPLRLVFRDNYETFEGISLRDESWVQSDYGGFEIFEGVTEARFMI